MYKPKFVQVNETHKILWYFKIETGYLIPVWRLDLVLSNKKKRVYDLTDLQFRQIIEGKWKKTKR